MSEKIRVGIIGLGGISRWAHMPFYAASPDIEVAAICDKSPSKIENFKKEFSLPETVASFENYKDLLNVKDLDFIDVCTPNYLHSIIAVEALEKGFNVFCEKPDAVSVEEALKMQAASEKSGKHLMIMRNNRYRQTSKYVKKYIADGNAGEIYCGRCGWQRRRGIPGKGGWFTTKEQSGGGPLIDLGVHFIDLAIWLMGNPKPVAVSGCTYSKFADNDVSASVDSAFGDKNSEGTFNVEDLAMGLIRFDNGACLQIEFSWASNVERDKVFYELRGTKAGIVFEDDNLKIFTEAGGTLVNVSPVIRDNGNQHGKNIRHFIDVIKGNADPDFVPEQGINMIKILCAMYKSAETGREVVL